MLEKIGRNVRSLLSLNRDREFRTLAQMLDLNPKDSLLDVGSGDGYWTERFASRAARVTGLEPDGTLLDHARKYHDGTNIEYEQGVAESLPFPSETFDKVVSVSAVEHFGDPVKGLEEMFRVLRPAGRLAISVDALISENSSSDFRRWHAKRHHVTRYFREEELVSILTTIGFRVERKSVHLFSSALSRSAREAFIRRPRQLVLLFPLIRGLVALGDALPAADSHGQIVALSATRPTEPTNGGVA